MDTEIVLPQEGRERAGTAEAKLAGRMLLTSSIIVNVIEEDTFLVLASVLSVSQSAYNKGCQAGSRRAADSPGGDYLCE